MEKENSKNIFIIDDDELIRRSMSGVLKQKYNVSGAESAEKGLDEIRKNPPQLILLDITLPGLDGIEALKQIKTSWPEIPVIMLTAVDSIPKVVESIKLGAYQYLTKPMNVEELLVTIERALESIEMRHELEQRRKLQLVNNREFQLLGASPALEKVRRQIETVSKTDSTVLIEGETGTGKELVAREIHAQSSRANKPFVAINCGAIPRELVESEFFGHKRGAFTGAQTSETGKFVLANRGTLLLDEIGELPPDAQSKLLRVLETQEFYPVGGTELVKVDVRVIASTNRNLKEMTERGIFREDLFFRLHVFRISIPPLHERPEDIRLLAEFFMKKYNVNFGKNFQSIDPEAQERLIQNPWKGNVRELRNIIEQIILSEKGPVIRKEHLQFLETYTSSKSSGSMFSLPPGGVDLEELEKKLILQALEKTRGNRTKAAKLLKLTPPTLYYRIEKYGLKEE